MFLFHLINSEGVIIISANNVEMLFIYFDETAIYLEKNWNVTYLEGVAEAGENLFNQAIRQPLAEEQKQILEGKLNTICELEFEKEDIRKAIQLAVLKGMKGKVQPHHSMTPDAVCLFVSYLVNKVIGKREDIVTILDLAVGSGNLLSTLLNQSSTSIHARGFEVDETLLKLAFVGANLQRHELDLFHEDSIEPLHFPKVDCVVTDLPVGYYPKEDVSKGYELKGDEGQTYVHHLMIEQAIKHTKPGGYLIFIVPNYLFESDQAPRLNQYIKEHANIIGLLQLPMSMFQSEKLAKSIFILQMKGEGIREPRQALLAELPSFSNKEALADMIQQLNKWFEQVHGVV